MERRSMYDDLLKGFADAVADIRQKVIEEPMYGRAVTDGPEGPQWPEAREAEPSFGSSTHVREMEPDLDLDR
jgi:hypothetical protein